jgi:tetratricopeptide (TPR) repeat protein
MKKTIIIVFLGFIQICLFSQTKLDVIFENANKLYTEEKYEESIKYYNQILDNGYESSELYYNIGNAYFKLRVYPRAILNYEKALLIDPENENVQHNLAKAKMYNVDKIDEIPEFIAKSMFNELIGFFSSNSWAIISMIFFVLTIGSLLIYFFSAQTKIKKIFFYSALIVLIISLSSFFFSYHAKSDIKNSNGAIIMQPTVTVKGSPRDTGTELFIIHEGTKVIIINKLDNWFEIKLMDGKQGWLPQSTVERI